MFTTVLSSITMNSAKHIAPSVHHLRFSSVMAGISGSPPRSAASHAADGVQHLLELARAEAR